MRWYTTLLGKHPFATQALTTGALFLAGDVIAQTLVERTQYKAERSLRLVFFGTCIAGPAMVLWYRFLAKNIVNQSPNRNTLVRVACDQLLFSPVFLGLFFLNSELWQGHSAEQVQVKFENQYVNTLIGNWGLWPFVQMINFRLVPLNHQALLVNTVGLGWNTYLSYVASR